MAQTKSQIQALLEEAHTAPRHRFGQNFMIDQNLVRLIADAGQIEPTDLVIEVGPGTGTLTEELLSRGARVLACEIDRDLAGVLRTRFAENGKFQLIEGDALSTKHSINADLQAAIAGRSPGQTIKLVANLPYNIASPLVIELLIAGVDLLVFTVQREVADRLRATDADDAYGPLSVMANMLSKVEVIRTLSAQAFWPAPKIESALVRMTRADQLGGKAAAFSTFVQKIFSFRRKTLRKGFMQAGFDPGVLERLAIEPTLRPENLSPAQFRALFDASGGGSESQAR